MIPPPWASARMGLARIHAWMQSLVGVKYPGLTMTIARHGKAVFRVGDSESAGWACMGGQGRSLEAQRGKEREMKEEVEREVRV